MKKGLYLLLAILPLSAAAEQIDPLSGETIKIDPARPPDGAQLVQILLENQSIKLADTPCGRPGDTRTLQQRLALTLGDGLNSKKNKVFISGQCKPDKFESSSGIQDIWHCKLAAVESTKKGGFVASSNLHFGIKKDTWEFIPEAFQCT